MYTGMMARHALLSFCLDLNTKQDFKITSLLAGRFTLKADEYGNHYGDILDNHTQILYTVDRAKLAKDQHWNAIPGLNVNDKPIDVLFLFALAHQPQNLPDPVLLDKDLSPKVKMLNAGDERHKLMATDVFFQYPEGGIESPNIEDVYYIPGASEYGVKKATSEIWHIPTNTPVTSGTGRDGIVLIRNNANEELEIEIAFLLAIAFGKYSYKNFDNPIIYIDGNSSNLTVDNVKLELERDSIVDTAIKTEEDYETDQLV